MKIRDDIETTNDSVKKGTSVRNKKRKNIRRRLEDLLEKKRLLAELDECD